MNTITYRYVNFAWGQEEHLKVSIDLKKKTTNVIKDMGDPLEDKLSESDIKEIFEFFKQRKFVVRSDISFDAPMYSLFVDNSLVADGVLSDKTDYQYMDIKEFIDRYTPAIIS